MADDRLLDWVLVVVGLCACTLTGLALYQAARPRTGAIGVPEIRRLADWHAYASVGHPIGPADARVTIVVFSDYQCPYCAAAHAALDSIRREYPGDVRVVQRHWPLDRLHPYARSAAHAAECATVEGRFDQFSDVLYRKQGDIGRREWTDFALEAGVRDTTTFGKCTRERQFAARIAADERAVSALGARGTPTVIVNDRLFSVPPTKEQLASEIRRVVGFSRPAQ